MIGGSYSQCLQAVLNSQNADIRIGFVIKNKLNLHSIGENIRSLFKKFNIDFIFKNNIFTNTKTGSTIELKVFG